MKYAVAMVMDQTVGFVTAEADGCETSYRGAKLFDELYDAVECLAENVARTALHLKTSEVFKDATDADILRFATGFWIEEVADEAEFRSRPDTW